MERYRPLKNLAKRIWLWLAMALILVLSLLVSSMREGKRPAEE